MYYYNPLSYKTVDRILAVLQTQTDLQNDSHDIFEVMVTEHFYKTVILIQ